MTSSAIHSDPTHALTVSLETARAYLDALDLNYIVDVMCSARYPLPRWNREDAMRCLQRYKNFLWLQKKYDGDIYLVPSKEIDEMWHNHILYTQNYVNDCKHIFGYYFHHKPAAPDENPQQLVDDYLQTKAAYFAEFNEELR